MVCFLFSFFNRSSCFFPLHFFIFEILTKHSHPNENRSAQRTLVLFLNANQHVPRKNLSVACGTPLFAETARSLLFLHSHDNAFPQIFLGFKNTQDKEMNVMMKQYWDRLTVKEKQALSSINIKEVCTAAAFVLNTATDYFFSFTMLSQNTIVYGHPG